MNVVKSLHLIQNILSGDFVSPIQIFELKKRSFANEAVYKNIFSKKEH